MFNLIWKTPILKTEFAHPAVQWSRCVNHMSLLKVLKFITNHPMNEGQRLKSIVRFAKWQISSRLAPGAILCEWVNGSRFLVRNGETGLTGNLYAGLQEFADMGYLLHVLRAEDTFVDIGANVGAYTILAGAAIGARVHAFEPIPSTYLRLLDNIRINNIEERVVALSVGLAASDGNFRFTNDLNTVNHAIADSETHENTVDVPVTTLDLAMERTSPNLIKIDVEGYETRVLQGAITTLADSKLHSIIMELNGSGNRYGFDDSKIVSMLLDIGFKTFSYDPSSRQLIDLHGKHHIAGNTLFVRNEALVRERVASAPKFKLRGIDL